MLAILPIVENRPLRPEINYEAAADKLYLPLSWDAEKET